MNTYLYDPQMRRSSHKVFLTQSIPHAKRSSMFHWRLCILLLCFIFPGRQTIAFELTDVERTWLADHPEIRIGIMDAWPPMNFVDEAGAPQGIGVDYIGVLNQRLGGILTIESGPFQENYDRVKNKALDALMDITPQKEREPFFNFTKPYLTIPHVIVGRKDGPYFNSEKDLAGKTVALERGYYNITYFQENYPEVHITEYNSTSEALDVVSRREADAYAGNREVVNYLLVKELLSNLQLQGRMMKPPVILAIGVRKDWPVLAGLLDRALSSMTYDETFRIHRKWLKKIEGLKTGLILTPEEMAWIGAHPVIRVAADRDYAPIEFLDDDGTFQGVSIDYLKRLSEMLGVKFQVNTDVLWQKAVNMIEQRELDVLPAAAVTQERKTFAAFTKPYLRLPTFVFTSSDVPYVNSLEELSGRKVAAVKGYAITEFLKRHYPRIDLIEVRGIQEGLKSVESKEVYAYLGSLLVTGHYIREGGYTNLKVSGETGFTYELAMAVRSDWPILVELLQKALDAIDKNERSAIFRNWITIRYEKQVNYALIWQIALGAGVLLLVFMLWNLSLTRQIIQRQQAERAARDSEQRLCQIVNFLPDATFVVDVQGKVQAWNRAMEIMTGVKAEDILGRGEFEYALSFYGKRRPLLADLAMNWDDKAAKAYDMIDKRGDVLFAEAFHPRLGEKGRYLWSVAGVIRNTDGKITGVIESVRDITSRKRMEGLRERYEFIVDSIEDMMSFINADYEYEAVNNAWCKMLQTSREQSIGKTAAEIWGTKRFENEIRPNLERCFAGKSVTDEAVFDLPVIGPRYHQTSMYPFLNKQQDITHVVVVTRDITERKEIEDAQKKRFDDLAQTRQAMLSMMKDLDEARKSAESMAQAKSEFLANMSHEIRTPMNSVLGFLELVLEDPSLPSLQRQHLSTARNSAHALLGVINDILDVSKLERCKLTLEQRPFFLHRVLQEIQTTMELKAKDKGLDLQLEIHPAVSGVYLSDPLRLRQILINLLGNAIKFTNQGHVAMRIAPAEEDGALHFLVEDTGIGIPVDRVRQIFEPFTQADASTTRRFGGTGLGTTIARELVELMGGRIWVESEKGQGSRFHVLVPLPQTDHLPDNDAQSLAPGTPRRFRIMLAEDVQANIDLATIRLEQQGHTVTVAWNGREAVEAFERGHPDLILMDIQMPEMSGLEATTRIREREAETGEHLPIIAMTASVTKKERQTYLNAGMDAVVAKPIDFGELFQIMEKAIPAGVGQIVSKIDQAPGIPPPPELQPLEGVDLARGLKTWQNAEAYTKALLGFAQDYENTAADLTRLVEDGDLKSASRLAHTLKGVAGNLAVTDVMALAASIDAALREQRLEAVKAQLPTFTKAFHTAVAAIRRLDVEPAGKDLAQRELDLPRLTVLFGNMLAAFEQFNPSVIKPFLLELQEYLPQDQLSPIVQHLERFDFDGAKHETRTLANTLHINVEA